MGKLIATCGHEVASLDDEYQIVRKDWDRYGNRVVSYDVVCLKCKQMYEGDILETLEAEKEWLSGGGHA